MEGTLPEHPKTKQLQSGNFGLDIADFPIIFVYLSVINVADQNLPPQQETTENRQGWLGPFVKRLRFVFGSPLLFYSIS